MGNIKLRDIINANAKALVSVLPDASLQNAAREISAHRVGILMVVDHHGDVIGILSERDVTRAFADQGAKAIDAAVADYMTTDVVMCDESEAPYTATWLMHEYGIRHLIRDLVRMTFGNRFRSKQSFNGHILLHTIYETVSFENHHAGIPDVQFLCAALHHSAQANDAAS